MGRPELAGTLAPYQSPRLATIEIDTKPAVAQAAHGVEGRGLLGRSKATCLRSCSKTASAASNGD
jgi:hypothetical protein